MGLKRSEIAAQSDDQRAKPIFVDILAAFLTKTHVTTESTSQTASIPGSDKN